MSRSEAPAYAALLAAAHELADASGPAILPYFRRQLAVDNKAADGSYDPVTAADRAAEKVIVKLIARRFPDHGVVGEEFGIERADARFRWIIDPIDGTRSFVTGSPMWGTLIGLMDGPKPILGVADQPYTRERFWSGKTGAHMRDASGKTKRIKTRACRKLGDAILMSTHPDLFAPGREQDAFLSVKGRVRMTRYGGDCYAYWLLACGFVDLVIETGLKSYDVAALIPIIEKAGGAMTSWDGGSCADGGQVVAAGDPKLHEKVMKVLGS